MSQYPPPPSNPNPYAYQQANNLNPYAASSATAYQPPPPPQPPTQPTPQPSSQPAPSPAPAAANPSIPYIGALISLVSKAQLRYEGTLYTIDPKASTVTLSQVRCFGSENRGAAAAEFVPASSKVYEFIVFSGKDIHDLHVMQKQEAEQHDPAILSAKQQTTAPQQHSAFPPSRAAGASALEEGELDEPAIGQLSLRDSTHSYTSHRGHGSRGGGGGRSYYNASSSSSSSFTSHQQQQQQPKYTVSILSSRPLETHELPQQRQRGGGGGGGGGMASKDILKSEFDFETSNARFNKGDFVTQLQQQQQHEHKSDAPADDVHAVTAPAYELPKVDDDPVADVGVEAGAAATAAKPLVAVAYDKKKSFFDDLGNDKAGGGGGGGRGGGRGGGGGRQNDRETFGDMAVRGGGRYRGGGRGGGYGGGGYGGAGGGGGYRGRGRGGGQRGGWGSGGSGGGGGGGGGGAVGGGW